MGKLTHIIKAGYNGGSGGGALSQKVEKIQEIYQIRSYYTKK